MTSLQEVPTEELLNFQDFSTNDAKQQNTNFNNQIQINIKPDNPDAKQADLKEDGDNSNSKSFWTLEYYQQFFDVDTDEVLQRLFASINPKDSLGTKLDAKPDLYGPFWITITLIFTIAISGNMANYLTETSVNSMYHWKYDFHLVSYAATAIISYICLVPTLIWFLLKWSLSSSLGGEESNVMPSMLKIMCLYGYSLFIFIPTSILWTIQVEWFRLVLVIIAAVLSGSVLLMALFPSLRMSKHKFIFALAIVLCHFLLALSFVVYFFHVPDTSSHSIVSTASNHSMVTAAAKTIDIAHAAAKNIDMAHAAVTTATKVLKDA